MRKMKEFCVALETLKDGYAFDIRYKFTDKQFKTPHVLVLCNKLPPRDMLGVDRWDVEYAPPATEDTAETQPIDMGDIIGNFEQSYDNEDEWAFAAL